MHVASSYMGNRHLLHAVAADDLTVAAFPFPREENAVKAVDAVRRWLIRS